MKKNSQKSGHQVIKKRLTRFSRVAQKKSEKHIRENLVNRLPNAKNVRLLILEWVLLVSIIIFLAIAQSFWYADSYSKTAFVEGGTYAEATLGKVNSLNPLFASTDSEKALSKLMFSTLTAVDYSGHTGLDLASSVTADETGKIWTVDLKDNLKWSDGEELDNSDVLFTVNLIKNPKVNTTYSSNLNGVQITEEEGKLVFSLPAAYANFPSLLNIPILPEHILKDVDPALLLEDEFSVSPVSSGPFAYNAVQSASENGEKVFYLAANQHYYGSKPKLESFSIHAYPESKGIVSAINSGVVTATADLLPTDADKVNSIDIYQKQTAINSGVYAFLNNSSNVLSDKSLRQAIQEGLDMRSLRAPLGDELDLDYPILSSQIELNYPVLPEYNPEAAKAKIAEAGVGDSILRLVTTSTGYFPALAENLEFQLENLGFQVETEVYEPNQEFIMNIIRPRSYDILLYEMELGPDPDLFAYYHSSQATSSGLNLSNYRNSLVDNLALSARSTMDPALRKTRYESFLRYWVSDVPAIGIYQVNMSYFVNKKVKTFSEDDKLVYPTDRFANVNSWAVEQAARNRTP